MKLRLAPFVILACVILASSALPAVRANAADVRGDRIALIIGNAKYPDSEKPLREPINDARDLADELKRDAFDVDIMENLSGDGMRRALDKFYGRVKPGSVALVFYSGFGIQSGRQSYMIPIDAQIWTESDVRRDGFSIETVLGEINSRGANVKIALIDASRRNPFERRFRSFSAGLAPVIAPGGTLVMYSAALSSVVADNGGDHSLFVNELLKEIRVPDLTAEETLNRTRVGVTRASRSEQVPWISSSLADDFAFVPGSRIASGSAPGKGGIIDRSRDDFDNKSGKSSSADSGAGSKTANADGGTKSNSSTSDGPREPVKDIFKDKDVFKDASTSKDASTFKDTSTFKDAVIKDPPIDEATRAANEEKRQQLALANDPTIKTLNGKLADNPSDASALYRRGQVYASKGAYTLAIKDFDEAIRLNPRDVEAFNNRCWARTVVNDLTAALKDCNEALRLRPNFVDALDSRGLVNLKSGQAKNAIADFDAALKINPRLTSSLYGRGLAKQRSGMSSEGDIDVASAKGMDPNIVQEFESYGVR